MPFTITDQQLVVGAISLEDAVDLPADDTITSAVWSSVDSTDSGTDVTVVAGDASSGTSDGDLNSVTVQASGTGEGAVVITALIGTASGASLVYTDTGQVNGGAAASVAVGWGTPAAIPAA